VSNKCVFVPVLIFPGVFQVLLLLFNKHRQIKKKKKVCCRYVKFALEQAMKAQPGVEILIYSFFNPGARWGWVVNATTWRLYPRKKDPISLFQEAGLVPGPDLVCAHLFKNFSTRTAFSAFSAAYQKTGLHSRTITVRCFKPRSTQGSSHIPYSEFIVQIPVT
jgi:hypothetical protein